LVNHFAFYVATLSFKLIINPIFFPLLFSSVFLVICWNLHARQTFPSPFTWRAESDARPFGRLHRKRETEC